MKNSVSLSLFIVALQALQTAAADDFVGSALPSTKAASQLCGLYAVYGAAQAIGESPSFADILDQEFVSTLYGSTADDLVRCSEHIGLKANIYSNLGQASLRHSETPLILHVSSHGRLDLYDHWVLFLGLDSRGQCTVADFDGRPATLSLAELLTRWDGTAIVIHKPDSTAFTPKQIENAQSILTVLLMSVPILIGGLFAKYPKPRRAFGFLAASPMSIGAIFAVGFISQVVALSDTNALRYLEVEAGSRSLPETSVDELRGFINSRTVTQIVDCRYEQDFGIGSIPGAVNIPVNATYNELAEKSAGLRKDVPVVVFCQSDRCTFSDEVARRMVLGGFEKVSIYRGGWIEWGRSP